MADHQKLIELVQPQLQGDETVEAITKRLLGAAMVLGQKLDDKTASELAEGLVSPAEPPPPPEVAMPRLIVDWGDYPRLGHRSTPHFLLLCPDAYQQGRPQIHVQVDDLLDNDFPADKVRTMRSEGPGLWGFHVPFSLTTEGNHCLPGHYVINVSVKYHHRDLVNSQAPEAFHCAIRLRIQDPEMQAERTLEIDGDGKSIINLQGQDLSDYGRVIIKGGDKGIINLHNSETLTPENETDPVDTPAAVTHTFDLKPEMDFQGPRPHLSPGFAQDQPTRMAMAMFLFEDESRILLIPKPRVTIGRNRGIPIVLRFLPRSAENDKHSLNISRDHLTLELGHAGLLVQDRGEDRHGGHTGALYVADQVVQDGEDHLLGPDQVNANLSLELPYGLQYDETFEFELDIFGDDSDLAYDASQADEELRLLLQAVGTGRKPPLWGFVEHNGMESVRLRRRRNLEQEQYVLLYRKGLIGNSYSRCPIYIDDDELPAVAAQLVYLDRAFWLHNLGNEGTVTVEGQVLEAGEMVPLREGLQLQLGQTSVQFQQAQQLHL